MARKETKAAVMRELTRVAREALGRGVDAYDAVLAAFPGTPTHVAAEAWLAAEQEATQAWWEEMEKTIDGEVVKSSLLLVGGRNA